jgi:hypothetical protein
MHEVNIIIWIFVCPSVRLLHLRNKSMDFDETWYSGGI